MCSAAFFMSKFQSPLLVVLAGPTASGKTQVGISLANQFGASVVNADSRQFYREMPIGTAAPNAKELSIVPHYFVGNKCVANSLDVLQFMVEAREKLTDLFRQSPVHLVVGGSGLYIKALLEGMDDMPGSQPQIRNRWEEILKNQGLEALQNRLLELDPDYYKQVDLKNPQRLMRALEVCESSGKPFSSFRKNKKEELPWKVLKLAVFPGKELLHQRIADRVDAMVNQGLVDEVKSLLPFRSKNALQTVGYSEIFDFLDGKTTLEDAIGLIKTHTRQYAKRQLTWFRKDPEFQWFSPEETNRMANLIKAQAIT